MLFIMYESLEIRNHIIKNSFCQRGFYVIFRYMEGRFRLIDSGPGDALWNMAVDEALLVLCGPEPVFRFYSWEVPSLSIGSFQKVFGLDLDGISARGVPLVRRPTGGRAVLHDSELTYSLTCRIPSDFFPSDLMGSYKKIGACFLRGLSHIGLPAELVPVKKNSNTSRLSGPLCFSSPSWYEVLAGGKKLIGSAQRRLKNSFIQQGSLIIEKDYDALLSLMKFEDEAGRNAAREALSAKMTALKEHLPKVEVSELKSAVIKGFSEVLDAEFLPGHLTPEEETLAHELMEKKYSRREWNLERQLQTPSRTP
ncbi:MAG: lipoate--protein ligase family protein [Nitrospirota bacterium]